MVPAVDEAPETQPVPWRHRHLLDVDGLTRPELELVMGTTDAMREVLARPIPKVPALRGTAVTILFYEASTRTRVSFEVAAKNLSADVVNIAASSSSVSKGESLVDTVRTVEALGADMLVMRHSVSGAPYLAAEVFGGSVLNGGDGWHAHPSQALLDLYTLREPAPGRVARGTQGRDPRRRDALPGGAVEHLDADRDGRGPVAVRPVDAPARVRGLGGARGAAGRRFTVTSDVDAALKDADVVMALRIQKERMASGLLPSMREYAARYGLTRERLRAASPDVVVMHPGPMNEGVEIAADVAVDPRSVITEQVTNGVAVRMALLYLLAGARAADAGRRARDGAWRPRARGSARSPTG